MKERLHFIDVAKGILIVLVVIGHLANALSASVNDDDIFLLCFCNVRKYIWSPFYMPAFFIISGLCSNFNLEFFVFLRKNVKSLLIPAVLFGIPLYLAKFLQHTVNITDCCYGILFQSFWFLRSLFLSKMLYWTLCKFCGKHVIVKFLFCFLLSFVVSVFCGNIGSNDPGFVVHSCLLLPFLWIGQFFKSFDYSKWSLSFVSLLVYVTIVLVSFLMDVRLPYITLATRVSGITFLPMLLLSVSGTVVVLKVSRLIVNSLLLEKMGKQSLSLYLLHLIFMPVYSKIWNKLFCNSILLSLIAFVLSSFILLFTCSRVSAFVVKTRFKWILGR